MKMSATMDLRERASSCRRVLGLISLVLLVTVFACESPDPNSSSTPPFIESGDIDDIRKQGTLRVLVDHERELITAFAREQGLEPFWVVVDSRSDLIPFLLEGRGDLIAANLTATAERRHRVAFTVPVKRVREQVATRRRDLTIQHPADLEGRRVAVRRSSSFWRTLERLREEYPGIEIEEVPENVDTDEILHRVATRRLDLTVADSNLLQRTLGYRDDLRVACDLTRAHLARPDEIHTGDLTHIREEKVLRLLTRNSAATYFLWRGRLMGFDYELAHEFARSQGLRMDVIVPRRGEDLLTMLIQGKGDLVAASLTPTEERRLMGVEFSRPYNQVSQVVVAPVGESGLDGPEDLADRTLYVRHSSSYWNSLSRLRANGVPLILQAAPEYLETEEIIGLVAGEIYPLTVADSHVLDIELTWRDDVTAAFPLGEPVDLAWAVRATNPELLAAANAFIAKEYRGLTYNVLHSKYFENPKKIRRQLNYRTASSKLSPYDDLIKRYADEHDFDWRLIVAQVYEESGFDPVARSFAGAVGLLQVLPRTAAELGHTDLEDPETNIEAGLTYLAWVRERFEEGLPVRDRMWFTLAGYNVGPGHVRDARRLAVEKGWNPDRWFDNVERAMLLLSRPEYARQARHGYCRGSEPVQYVREIRSRYEAYLDMLAKEQPADVATR
jgi:membrane-bound lytic murein transglycosylase F